MYQIKRTNAADIDFQNLVSALDKDLAIRDGDEHAFFAQFNKIEALKYVVVIYEKENAIACGAIKAYNEHCIEIKRMFVLPEKRGKSIASLVLRELESWAKALGYQKAILETGVKQPEAIRLYQKNNFYSIKNYGQYVGVASSVCFEKILAH
jgi:GNAT superfamily N-acetyltransferase